MRVFDFASPHGVDQSLEDEIVRIPNIIQFAVVSGVLGTCVQITIGCFNLLSCRPSRLNDYGDRVNSLSSLAALRILCKPVFRRSTFPWHLLIPIDECGQAGNKPAHKTMSDEPKASRERGGKEMVQIISAETEALIEKICPHANATASGRRNGLA
jgi:hypothetical protein